MALERAIEITDSVTLDNTWIEFPTIAEKGPYINGYITAQKSESLSDIKGLYLDIGVETGFENTIVRINTIKLDFQISKGSDIDTLLGMVPVNNLPNGFFVKPHSMFRYNGTTVEKDETEYDIIINMVVL